MCLLQVSSTRFVQLPWLFVGFAICEAAVEYQDSTRNDAKVCARQAKKTQKIFLKGKGKQRANKYARAVAERI